MGGEVGLVSLRWWETLMQIINVLVLFAALSYFLFKPVTKMLQDRRDKIAGDLRDAENKNKEAEELKAIYQGKIDGAQEEAQQIIRDAVRKGDIRKDEIIKEAQEEAKKMLDRAKLEINREKLKAMDDLKDEMIEIALAAASRMIQENLDDERHQKLIQQYIEEMGDVHV